MWRVPPPPAGLRKLPQLEGHRYAGGPKAGSLRDALPQAHGREGRLDRVRRTQAVLVLGVIVVKLQQHIDVVGDLRGGLGPLRAVVGLERLDGLEGVLAVLSVAYLSDLGDFPAHAGRIAEENRQSSPLTSSIRLSWTRSAFTVPAALVSSRSPSAVVTLVRVTSPRPIRRF